MSKKILLSLCFIIVSFNASAMRDGPPKPAAEVMADDVEGYHPFVVSATIPDTLLDAKHWRMTIPKAGVRGDSAYARWLSQKLAGVEGAQVRLTPLTPLQQGGYDTGDLCHTVYLEATISDVPDPLTFQIRNEWETTTGRRLLEVSDGQIFYEFTLRATFGGFESSFIMSSRSADNKIYRDRFPKTLLPKYERTTSNSAPLSHPHLTIPGLTLADYSQITIYLRATNKIGRAAPKRTSCLPTTLGFKTTSEATAFTIVVTSIKLSESEPPLPYIAGAFLLTSDEKIEPTSITSGWPE